MLTKLIQNFPAYRISENGIVESCWTWGPHYPGMRQNPKWKRVQLKQNSKQYIPLNLCDAGGKRRRTYLHRLLAETFISPPPYPKACVRHLDGNPSNNAVSNLAWGTYVENENDKHRHGTWTARITNAKLTKQGMKTAFKMSKNGITQNEIALKLSVSRPTISRLISGKTWRQK